MESRVSCLLGNFVILISTSTAYHVDTTAQPSSSDFLIHSHLSTTLLQAFPFTMHQEFSTSLVQNWVKV